MVDRATRRAVVTVLALAALAGSACGDGSTTTAERRELDLGGRGEETTVAESGIAVLDAARSTPLPAGTHRTGVFEPTMIFTVGDDWHLASQSPGVVALQYETYGFIDPDWKRVTVFAADRFRYTPAELRSTVAGKPTVPGEVATWPRPPADLARSLAEDVGLAAGPIETTEIGGRPAKAFDFAAPDLPDQPTGQCVPGHEVDCVEVFRDERDMRVAVLEGARGRFYVIDVDGQRVVVDVRAPEDDAEAFLAVAIPVVESVRFP